MIDFGKYTWTIISAYGGASLLIMILVVQTLFKSNRVLKELLLAEQEKSIDEKKN